MVRGMWNRASLSRALAIAATTALLWAYSRVELPWMALGFVALVPWLRALDEAGSTRETLALGWALTVAFTATVFGWFPTALHRYTQVPLWICWSVMLVTAPLLQPQFLTAAVARHLVRRTRRLGHLRVELVFALAYVGTEWAWPKLFADTLGHGLHASALLRQAADVAGAPGLTLVLLLVNGGVLDAWRAVVRAVASVFLLSPRTISLLPLGEGQGRGAVLPTVRPAALGLALLLLVIGYGTLRLTQVQSAQEQSQSLTIGVVQANLTRYAELAAEQGTYGAVRTILDTHYALSDAVMARARPHLLIWPETVYPTTYGTPRSEDGAELDREIGAFVTANGVPLVFGAYDSDGSTEYNAAVFLEPARRGRVEFTAYRKAHLFPLTEWVPAGLEAGWLRGLLPWAGTWARGPGPEVVEVGLADGRTLRVAPLICYDSLFPGHVAEAARRGAELVVTLSNDAWFAGTPAPRLHLVVAAFRSIESRLPQVRSTTSGISALVDATGEIRAETQVDTRDVLVSALPVPARLPTLARAWGDWLGPWALAGACALLVQALVFARRRRWAPA